MINEVQEDVEWFQVTKSTFTCSKSTVQTPEQWMCGICSKLIMKTPEQHHWRYSDVFIVNFEHIPHSSGVSIADFEQVNAG